MAMNDYQRVKELVFEIEELEKHLTAVKIVPVHIFFANSDMNIHTTVYMKDKYKPTQYTAEHIKAKYIENVEKDIKAKKIIVNSMLK